MNTKRQLQRLQKAWDTYNSSPAYQQWRQGIHACPENHYRLLQHLDELRETSQETDEPDYEKIRDITEKWMHARDSCPHCSSVQVTLAQSEDYRKFRKTKRKLERRLDLPNINVLRVEKEGGL